MTRGYLLDTHVLLWWLGASDELSQGAREAISNGEHLVYVSAGAAWEMAIKRGLGRLSFPDNLREVLRSERIDVLPIGLEHALAVAALPAHHQDPFDRIQVAQARLERLTLVTRDPWIARYDVELLRA